MNRLRRLFGLRQRLSVTVRSGGVPFKTFGYKVEVEDGFDVKVAHRELLKLTAARCAARLGPEEREWVLREVSYMIDGEVLGPQVDALMDERQDSLPGGVLVGDGFKVGGG